MDAAKGKNRANYDLSSPFLLKPGELRLIEIHPTRRCNLRCQHCYSESGPDEKNDLSLESLKGFLLEAARLGYRYVGVSGGEPLLWSELENFLEFAKDANFSTAVTTNGTLLSKERVERLGRLAGIVSVSVDGPPAEHATMRNSQNAFARMRSGLELLRISNIPFTIAFTLTRYNSGSLSWLYDFAVREGAAGLHIHPLCGFGAANTNLSDAVPDSLEFKVASYLLALLIETNGPGGPAVTFDVMNRFVIEKSSWPMIKENDIQLDTMQFSDLVPSLVVESDGCIVPFIYGFPRFFALGSIKGERFSQMFDTWRSTYALPVAKLFRDTLERLSAMNAEYVDLFGELLITAGDISVQA
jgi:hypothetical protein